MSWILSEKPGVMVLTFHVPSFRVESFLSFLFKYFLLGAYFPIRLSVFTLNPTHPVRLADRGEAEPYWLGAAQLEAGGSCPMKYNDLSYRQKQPLASNSSPIKLWTYNR